MLLGQVGRFSEVPVGAGIVGVKRRADGTEVPNDAAPYRRCWRR